MGGAHSRGRASGAPSRHPAGGGGVPLACCAPRLWPPARTHARASSPPPPASAAAAAANRTALGLPAAGRVYAAPNDHYKAPAPAHTHTAACRHPLCRPVALNSNSLKRVQTLLREFEFKHWGATITIAGTVMPIRPNPSQIPGRRSLRKYIYVPTCTHQLRQTRDHIDLTFIHG